MRGRLGDVEVVFLPRHGRGHRLLPSEINFRANIFALKQLGVRVAGQRRRRRHRCASTLAPGHVVIPDQFIDRTVARPSTFFGERHRRARQPRRSGVRRARRRRRRRGARRRRHRAPRRHVHLHGGAAVLDPRRVAPVPAVGRRRHRHDQLAGGQAGARGGDLLREPGAGHRLRLLEVGRRARGDRRGAAHPGRQRRAGAARRRRRRRAPAGAARRAPARARSSTPSSPIRAQIPAALRARAGAADRQVSGRDETRPSSCVLVVVSGSVAIDSSVEAPHGGRRRTDVRSAARRSTFRWRRASSRRCAWWAWSGADFPRDVLDELRRRGIDLAGVEERTGQHLPLDGPLPRGRERARHAAPRPRRVRRLPAEAAGRLPRLAPTSFSPTSIRCCRRRCSTSCARPSWSAATP